MCIRDRAYTIHKKIYRQRNFSNDLDNFSLDDNLHQHTLFIVDEASMIANDLPVTVAGERQLTLVGFPLPIGRKGLSLSFQFV